MPRLLKEMIVIALMAIALIYLANPTAGLLELIPDNVPLIGNLDEAGAVTILLAGLRYYGIDLSNIWRREPLEDKEKPQHEE